MRQRRDGSWRWGCAGSQGPGDDEPGGVGEEPRCSAWLMRKTSSLQPSLPFVSFQFSNFFLLPFLQIYFTSVM